MKFKYAILYVDDVAQTIDFFERAFGCQRRMLHESGDYGELATGETTLSFSSRRLLRELGKDPGRPSAERPVFELAFETKDVERSLKKALAAGAQLIQGAREEAWGQTVAYVSEPNGFLIELCTPVRA